MSNQLLPTRYAEEALQKMCAEMDPRRFIHPCRPSSKMLRVTVRRTLLQAQFARIEKLATLQTSTESEI